MNIEDIEKGQVWRSKHINRDSCIVSSVNIFNNTVYWYYDGFEGNIFDMPFNVFTQEFHAPVEVINKPQNPDLTDEDEDDLGLIL